MQKVDSLKELAQGCKRRDQRALARSLTLIEQRPLQAEKLFSHLASKNHATILGVTGSPGAGKSTLVNQIAHQLSERGDRVAIVAVDPSSPFSGGALLGDRVRMELAERHAKIFIRSLASRGSGGGLSLAVYDAVELLSRSGFDWIVVETVGVGQAEIDIVRLAHICLVVLVPGMGDGVQALKAGILEIADVFVINKADLPGVDSMVKDLRLMLSLVPGDHVQAKLPILTSIATTARGVEKLIATVDILATPAAKARKQHSPQLIEPRLRECLGALVWAELQMLHARLLAQELTAVCEKRKTIQAAARNLLRKLS